MIKGNFEITQGEDEVKRKAKEENISVEMFHSDAEFSSTDIAIKGEKHSYSGVGGWKDSWRGIRVVSFRSKAQCLKQWAGISEEIPGLHCPYCNSQTFRTDSPNVAVCGAAPGWFFFYRRLDQEKEPETKTRLIIKNGQLVEEEDTVINDPKKSEK